MTPGLADVGEDPDASASFVAQLHGNLFSQGARDRGQSMRRTHAVQGAVVRVACALGLWAWLGASLPVHAAELSVAAVKEITQLLERIEASNCAFMRNGSWYTPAEARLHLQRKLDYMVERKMLGSAEQFITDTASASSLSGRPYMVRCGNNEPMPSAAWLNAELRRIRTPS
jgi:hypothetical protein